MSDLQDRASSSVNDTGTCTTIDTPVTQAGSPAVPTGQTLGGLIDAYQTDPVSSFHKLRYHVRRNHVGILARIGRQYGSFELRAIKARDLKLWHMEWLGDTNKVSVAHSLISQLRTLCGFGAAMLEEEECERLCLVLHKLKFPQGQPRTEYVTPAQAVALRAQAHRRGWHSIALAQAIQFELMLRQKDVIGEWIPMSEPGLSDVNSRKKGKWFRGLRWEEIDQNMIVRHITSKKQKHIEIDIKQAPMLMDELALYARVSVDALTRGDLPNHGPIVICETSGHPYTAAEFRRKWRIVANMAGIPKAVRNMDSRAGAITEATEAGADIEHVKHAATHSEISQTQRYSRGATDKIAQVQAKRNQYRFRTAG
jgi:hypothetical protein